MLGSNGCDNVTVVKLITLTGVTCQRKSPYACLDEFSCIFFNCIFVVSPLYRCGCFLIVIPCSIRRTENNQPNALNIIFLLIPYEGSNYMASSGII
jgi:hypothetical protein